MKLTISINCNTHDDALEAIGRGGLLKTETYPDDCTMEVALDEGDLDDLPPVLSYLVDRGIPFTFDPQ